MRLESEEENIRDISPSQIRIPTALKDILKKEARKNSRSLNAEVVSRLEASFNSEVEFTESPEGTKHTITVTKEQYDAMEKLMDQIRKSNVDLSKLEKGKPLDFNDDGV